MAKRGPKPKLTDEIEETICGLIEAGNTVEIAARAAGVSRPTVYAWQASKAPRMVRFRVALDRARAQAEVNLVGCVLHAAQGGSWRAASWLLEKRYPDRWTTIGDVADGNADEKPSEAELAEAEVRTALAEVDELARRRSARRGS